MPNLGQENTNHQILTVGIFFSDPLYVLDKTRQHHNVQGHLYHIQLYNQDTENKTPNIVRILFHHCNVGKYPHSFRI
mgnify:CR=1 FL=1